MDFHVAHSRFGLYGCIACWGYGWRIGRVSLCGNDTSQFDRMTCTLNQQQVNMLGTYHMYWVG